MARLRGVTLAPTAPTPGALDEFRSGTGKVIRPGDTVTVDSGSIEFMVKSLREVNGQVEVTVFGGPPKRRAWRTFRVERLHRKLQPAETRPM